MMMILQALLFSFSVVSVGYLVLRAILSRAEASVFESLSFHVGFFVYMLLQVLGLLWAPFNSVIPFMGAACIIAALGCQRSWQSRLRFGGTSVCFTVIAVLVRMVILTTDSYYFVVLSESFKAPEIRMSELSYFLNLWSPLGLVAFSTPKVWNMEVLYFLPLLSTLYFLYAFATMLVRLYAGKNKTIIALLLGFIVSTGQFLYHSIYLHNNFLSGQYLCLGLVFVLLFHKEKIFSYVYMFLVLVTAFAMLRMESSLFAVAFMGLVLPVFGVDRIRTPFSVVCVIMALWNFGIAFFLPGTSHLAGPLQFYFMGSLYVLFLGAIHIRALSTRLTSPKFFLVILVAGALGHLVLLIYKGQHLVTSDRAVIKTIFREEFWGWSWIFVLLSIFGATVQRKIRWSLSYRWALTVLGVFIILLLSLGAFRSPFHVGLGDSANRILMHVFPFAMLIALEGFLQIILPRVFEQGAWSMEKAESSE